MPGLDPGLERHLVEPLLAELLLLAEAARGGDPHGGAELAGAARGGRRPVVALNGPVGAGKTSLGRLLQERAGACGLRLAVASIDDFYLPWPARQRVLAGNPFGVSRVPPGSHDVPLALDCLEAWRAGGPLRLPRFDKTLLGGQGDRTGFDELEADGLVLEGWLLGCRPLGQSRLQNALQPDAAQNDGVAGLTPQERAWLPLWDQALEAYQPLWDQCVQLWLLRPQSWTLPRRWRVQAEARQRRLGGAWLPADDLDRLVRASLCSLPPPLYQEPLVRRAKGYALLDGRRRWIGGSVAGGSADGQLSSSPSSSTG